MITRQEFDAAFEKYHAANADKYRHLVNWTSVTPEQLAEAARAAAIELPEDLKEFMSVYGYGEIYFATVFCPLAVKPDGAAFSMWDYFHGERFGGKYLPISSNGDELWTGYRVQDGKCSGRLVNFDADRNDFTGEGYDSIWDFVLEVGLIVPQLFWSR